MSRILVGFRNIFFLVLIYTVYNRNLLWDIILIKCSIFFFALFVNVQYFSVVPYMFNIYTGVQMSFVDR